MKEEETKDYYYRFWLVRYPLYDKNTYESFEEFYEKVVPRKTTYDTRSEDEIMKDIFNIEKSLGKGGI